MKTLITALILLTVITTARTQNDRAATERLVNEFTEKLEARGIEDWFITTRYCSGTVEMFRMNNGKMCTSRGTYFEFHILWKEGDKTMIKKIDNCGLFFSMPLSDNEIWDFVKSNSSELMEEKVKPYETDNISGQPEARTAVHPCYREFVFQMEGDRFDHKFNLYQLTTDEEQPNKNYDYNQQLKIVALNNMMNPIMDSLKNTLRRQE